MTASKWTALMASIGFSPNLDTYNKLATNYSQPHRFYHNMNHIDAVLSHLDQAVHLADDSSAIEIALWFHDAVYNVFSSTNEVDSANWATTFLEKNGSKKAFSRNVHALIIATQHDGKPSSNDEQLMVDIDLSILGRSAKTYAQFELSVRKEYKLVPNVIYNKQRIKILQGFIARERIFTHDHFYNQLEISARSNLANAVNDLSIP